MLTMKPKDWKPTPEEAQFEENMTKFIDWLDENPEEEKKLQERYKKWLEEHPETEEDWV